MQFLEVAPMDLGADVRAVGVDLADLNAEPIRGSDAAAIWARVLPALAGKERWALDFFSHLDRVRDYCKRYGVAYREASTRSIVVPEPEPEALEALLARFEGETLGIRAGGPLEAGDAAVEKELARRGVDAYHPVFGNYYFCAVCDFSNGSLVVLTKTLASGEIARRLRGALEGMEVEVILPS
jgi:hypothetical protein